MNLSLLLLSSLQSHLITALFNIASIAREKSEYMNNIGYRICVVNENANVPEFREILGVCGFSLFVVLLNRPSQIPEFSLKVCNDHLLQYIFKDINNLTELSRYSYGLRAGLPGFNSRQWKQVFFTPQRPDRLCDPPSLLYNGRWGIFLRD
jgi:hypothetical protein